VGQTKRFHLIQGEDIKIVDGFTGMLEDICAPADEVDQFNSRIRDQLGDGPPRQGKILRPELTFPNYFAKFLKYLAHSAMI
jgi:hypothetical protein